MSMISRTLAALVVVTAACGSDPAMTPVTTTTAIHTTATTASSAATSTPPTTIIEPPQAATFDCLPDTCPEIVIAGDPAFMLPDGTESPFHGFADPTVRRDPLSECLWMAYSWPHLHFEGGGRWAVGVESHLAHSDDDGSTWGFDAVLWPSVPVIAPDGTAGYEDHEVPNLLPVATDDGIRWFAARLDYFVDTAGGSSRSETPSFRIAVMEASDPLALSDAEPAHLGAAATEPRWGIAADFSRMAPEVANCALWNEPALAWVDDRLLIALRCLAFPPASLDPDLTRSDIAVFATTPEGPPHAWNWEFAGILADGDDAAAVGGEGLTQIDLATARDGTLLAIVTPDTWDPERKDFIHHGCRVVEVVSLDPPMLARDASGDPIVRATIDASDTYPLGPAACTYDPDASTGVLMTRRLKGDGRLVATIACHRSPPVGSDPNSDDLDVGAATRRSRPPLRPARWAPGPGVGGIRCGGGTRQDGCRSPAPAGPALRAAAESRHHTPR